MKFILILFIIGLAISEIKLPGIDLSSWDETVYWDQLKDDVKFVILRAGYGKDTTDKVFDEYYRKCKEYDIPVGAYWYGYATTVYEAEVEAKAFMKRLNGKKFEYPVYCHILCPL